MVQLANVSTLIWHKADVLVDESRAAAVCPEKALERGVEDGAGVCPVGGSMWSVGFVQMHVCEPGEQSMGLRSCC